MAFYAWVIYNLIVDRNFGFMVEYRLTRDDMIAWET